MIAECVREAEVLEAVAFGRWPERCGDLAAHVASCEICADLVEVARALHDDRACVVPRGAAAVGRDGVVAGDDPRARRSGAHRGAADLGAAGDRRRLLRRRRRGARHRRLAIDALDGSDRRARGAASRAAAPTSRRPRRSPAGHGLPILVAVAAGLVLAPLALYSRWPTTERTETKPQTTAEIAETSVYLGVLCESPRLLS